MKVYVFGATGATGRWVTKLLLDKGHEVSAYVRNPDKINDDRINVFQGDIHDTTRISQSLKGHDSVISCLGSSTLKKSSQLEDMAKSITKAMKESGLNRIIYMATAGIENEFKGPFKLMIRMMIGNVIDDHSNAAKVYKSSDLNYTIVRPVQLSDGDPTGSYNEALHGLPKSKKAISRANVAMFMIKALEDKTYDSTSVGLTG